VEKLLELDSHFPKTGEPTVSLVAWGDGRGGLTLEKRAFAESRSPMYDFLKTVQPEAGCSFILVNALGAYEYYDDNRNGDGFPARPFKVGELATCGHPECSKSLDGWISDEETLVRHFKTFEKHGNIYRNHKNSDPSTSLGYIQKAIWNDRMHRVELLLKVVNDRAPDLAERIASHDSIPVSMGCLGVGTPITLADGRRKVVEDVVVGDRVRTHLGNAQRVFELHRRTYVGVVHTIKPEGGPPLTVTHEHPFFVAKFHDVKRRHGKKERPWLDDACVNGVWKLANELDADRHLLLQPIDRTVETPEEITLPLARLLGYYLAEGSLLRDENGLHLGIDLNCHQDDELLKELPSLIEALHLPEPYISVRSHSACARSVRVYSQHLALLCRDLMGVYSKKKFLDASVMLWAPELQRALFGAYANGDGCGNKNGSLQISTSSEELATQLLSLLPRFGVLASHQVLEHKPNKLVKIPTTEHVVYIGKQWAQGLRDVCAKIKTSEVKAKKEVRKIIGDYIVIPIRNIDRTAGSMPVYNFEVEEDNSYVAGGVAVHNCHVRWDVCTICGHRAPTRAQYCEHALRSLRQVLPDGRKVSVLNPSPKFFDISFVFRPADPTGWMLKKVADVSHGRPSAELGERVAAYRSRALELRTNTQKVASDLAGPYGRVAADVVSEWPALEGQALDTLAKLGSLSDTLSTLTAVGVVLSNAEVTQLMAKKAGIPCPPSDLDRLSALQPALEEVLTRYPSAAAKLAELVDFRLDGVKPQRLAAITDWVEKRGGYADYARTVAYAPSDTFQLPFGPGASYRAYQPGRTELLTMTDPSTGQQYQTTRGAAQDAGNEKSRSQLAGTALLGAMYAGGLRAALGRRAGLWTIPVGLAAGWATTKAIKDNFPAFRHPTYMTDQGIPVSGGTEFNKVSAFERPTPADVVHKAALDERPLAKIASHSPNFSSWLASTSLSEKVAAIVAGAETDAHDVGAPPELDLAVVVHNVCHIVWAD